MIVLHIQILDPVKSLQAWGSTGYWAHWFMLAGCILGALLPKRKAKAKDAKGKDGKDGKEGKSKDSKEVKTDTSSSHAKAE